MPDQYRPHHGVEPFADHRLRRHIDEDRAEQSEADADAGQDKIFPRRLQRFRRAVDADHQHGRQRRHFDRDPHQPHIVGDQREIHSEHQELIHRVIEAEIGGRQPSGLELVVNIARAEHASGEADERVQHDEHDVEIVDHEILAGRRPLHDEQHQRGDQSDERRQHVEPCRQTVSGEHREQRRGRERHAENHLHDIER